MHAPKVFFSHRHAEVPDGGGKWIRDKVLEEVNAFKDDDGKLLFQPVFGGRHAPALWKEQVSDLIRSCDLFVCVLDAGAAANENIVWEIDEARQHDKTIILAEIQDSCQIPASCAREGLKPVPMKPSSLLGALLPHLMLNRGVRLGSDTTRGELMAQYSVMTGSWEALINRRQNVNSFYSAVIATMLGGIGGCIINVKDLGDVTPLAVGILSLLGCYLSRVWEETIKSYGIASRAKSDVVSALETHLPAQLFDYEWKVMCIRRYLSTTQKDERVARYFSNIFKAGVALSLAAGLWIAIALMSSGCAGGR